MRFLNILSKTQGVVLTKPLSLVTKESSNLDSMARILALIFYFLFFFLLLVYAFILFYFFIFEFFYFWIYCENNIGWTESGQANRRSNCGSGKDDVIRADMGGAECDTVRKRHVRRVLRVDWTPGTSIGEWWRVHTPMSSIL